jgi:riboflavin synthase
MFTGIIETLGTIQEIKTTKAMFITVDSSITTELKIDQSVAHNGICLTVVELKDNSYSVTAIGETVQKESWKLGGDNLNLERHEVRRPRRTHGTRSRGPNRNMH